jgi:hypothetical protein
VRILLLIIVVCSFLQIKGQTDTIVWQNRDSIPSFGRIDEASFVIDSDYYIIGGQDGSGDWYSQVWKYKILTNTWQQMRDFPGGPVTTAVGFAISGYGYICTGSDSITVYGNDNEFWKYYPAVDTWQHKANFPGVPREGPIAFVYGQDAFVGMGLYVNDLWRYNAITDSWDSLSSIPIGREGPGISLIDSFAYIFGGGTYLTSYNDIWRYNINQDHWDSIGIMPGGLREAPLYWTFGKTVVIGYGFVQDTIVGWLGDTLAGGLFSYNSQTGIWDTVQCINFLDSTAADGGGCFQLGKTAYFFGGFATDVPNYSFYNNMWSFDASQFFPPDTTIGIREVSNESSFTVYPNPLSQDKSISISTSESGSVLFYDELGQLIDESKLSRGINAIKLTTDDKVIFYRATLQDGATENGKVIIY